jgi:ABC-type multidrug transport system fused ATPase/permease subunit
LNQRGRLTLLAFLSAVGGLAEATVLVVIARVAVALTNDNTELALTLGPLHRTVSIEAVIGAAVGLIGIRVALQFAQASLSASTTSRVLDDIRRSLVAQYLRASWSLQAAEREGRLQELLTTYASQGGQAVLGLTQGTVAAFNLLALVVTAFILNPAASVAVLGVATAVGLVLRPLRGAVRRRSQRSAEAGLAFATALTEAATTTQEIRVFNVEPQVKSQLDELSNTASERVYYMRFLSQLIPALYQGLALLLVLGALELTYIVSLSLASLGAIVLIMLRSLTYGQGIQTTIQSLHESTPYLVTLRREQERYRDAALPRGGVSVDVVREIIFDRVGFEYVAGQPVLQDVSVRVTHGEIIGIVGPTGAGKSTLVQVLLRLRQPTSGRVLVDGRNVDVVSIDDWYRHVAFVPQESRLFAGTVAANIKFFRDDADDAAIESAARRAHLHEDINSWPLGYATPVGERGSELSGGQRQRVCIARALVGEPDVVVLDEPTSALDPHSEALMRDTITSLAPHTTVFVIAHRMSTLTVCDRIMVVHDGTVRSFDEPARLEDADPFYKEALRLSGMR